jgi:hypothetical protein
MLGYKKWDEHLGPLAVKKWKQIQSCRFGQKPLLFRQTSVGKGGIYKVLLPVLMEFTS